MRRDRRAAREGRSSRHRGRLSEDVYVIRPGSWQEMFRTHRPAKGAVGPPHGKFAPRGAIWAYAATSATPPSDLQRRRGISGAGAQFRHPQSIPHQGGAQNACRIRTPGVSTCRRDLRYRSRAIGHRRSLFRNKGRRPRRIRVVESLHQGRNSVRYRGGSRTPVAEQAPYFPKKMGNTELVEARYGARAG